jgi:hypothetical protein
LLGPIVKVQKSSQNTKSSDHTVVRKENEMIMLIDGEDMRAEGTFKSVNEAKQFLREKMKDLCEEWDEWESGDHEDWSYNFYICEVKEIVHPVPNVKITVKLKTVKEA